MIESQDDSSHRQHHGTAKLSVLTRISASLTGSSIIHLVRAPDNEQSTVRFAGLSLVLVTFASGLGLWFALGIARGEYSLWHLPYVILAGIIVFTLDRAMLRAHWRRRAIQAAGARGSRVYDHKSKLTNLLSWSIRIAVSLVVSLTIASFIGLAIFSQDIEAHLLAQNRAENMPVYEATAKQVNARIAFKKQTIESLNKRAQSLRNSALESQSATSVRRKSLMAERAKLLNQKIRLNKDISCQTQNMIAEKTGTVRCDGRNAIAGEGNNWKAARALVQHAHNERQRVITRLKAIADELENLHGPNAGKLIPLTIQTQLNRVAERRAHAKSKLSNLIQNRKHRVEEIATQDSAYVPMPQGLIVRGEALVQLAQNSPWLAREIVLVALFLVVLDLVAIFGMTIHPAPVKLMVDEFLAGEIGTLESIAHAEEAMGQSRRRFLQARGTTVSAEEEFDRNIADIRQAAKTRELVSERIDKTVMDRFARAS